ncbi:hypothetical protein GYH30_050471 [Glycine max]|uniref:Uncharacterized protein n=2 Tax=Glycine subgen. Soja TaxID=1462606 RepID=A0A0R0FCG6_SOYBN|nr:hypothetical protein JHK87_050667 [Glycine soja]KAH1155167.1 hypothetical protein GYH30_050471 [Glycine max]RZB52712.1 hypothetical protein D0Y65_048972 [Glycine soja]
MQLKCTKTTMDGLEFESTRTMVWTSHYSAENMLIDLCAPQKGNKIFYLWRGICLLILVMFS